MKGMHSTAMSEEHDHSCYPLVYIAGPIGDQPIEGCRTALSWGALMVEEDRAVPVITHLHVMVTIMDINGYPKDPEAWLFLDGELIRRCDALFRIPGASPGADRELIYARDVLNIPVFSQERYHDAWNDFCQWSSWWQEEQGCAG